MKALVRLVCVTSVLALALVARGAPSGRPNVVIILADDSGWGDYGVHGNTNLATPNIDSLAVTGTLLDRFYVCPVCSPTRAEMLTGRYHPRGGVHSTSTGGERLNLDETTIAQSFKAAGYATGAFGKWHNGTQFPYHPNARGFEEYYGFTSGHWGSYFDPLLDHNGELTTGKGFLIDDLTDHAMAFIEQNRERPFLCYVPFNTPHAPMQVPDRFYEKFKSADVTMRAANVKQEDVATTRAVLAMMENIDWNVGRILKRLDDLRLTENTIVLYFSDNGPNTWRWNGGMKGKKGSTDEGGVRSPFLIRWPGHVKAGGRVPQIAGAIDLLPTLADMAGVKVVGDKRLDGKSIKPLLTGDATDWPDRMIFSTWGGKVSVRTQQYRMDDAGHLYDMWADPGQATDVAAQHADVAARLKKAMADWREEMHPKKEKDGDDRPFPIGHAAAPLTQLPARDGVGHGGVKRSARAPNCSYFLNWTNTSDTITWDAEVLTPGRYEAEVYYACPAADVGSVVELSLNGARVEGTVNVANDPPARGAENDRVPRETESYVKDFKPMKLGTIQLSTGRGALTLRAVKVAGKQVMEVRMVVLRRVD